MALTGTDLPDLLEPASRERVGAICALLALRGLPAGKRHAEMPEAERESAERAFRFRASGDPVVQCGNARQRSLQATPGENAPGVWRFRRSDKDFRCYQAGAERVRWALGWCPDGHCPAQNGCFALCFPRDDVTAGFTGYPGEKLAPPGMAVAREEPTYCPRSLGR